MNKLHIFRQYVFANGFPDIVGVTESWSGDKFDDGPLSLPGYSILRGDRRIRRGGGTLLYVRNTLCPTLVDLGTAGESYDELCGCRLRLSMGDSILVMVTYRPESNSDTKNSNLYNILRSATSHGDARVVVMGDFNFKEVSWSNFMWPPIADEFMDSILEAGLTQHVTFPTRGDSVLDLVFSNEPYLISHVDPLEGLGSSDHL